MKLTKTPASQNGYHKTSPQLGEVFVAPPLPTAFPAETIPRSLPLFLYNLSRFTFGDVRLLRIPQWGLILAAALWATGALPGRWWITGLALGLLIALQWSLRRWRQQDFVTFVASTLPRVSAQRLDTKEKIPVHVTGHFAVENKQRRFTWLPGFYRTFATREHALLCQAINRSFLWLGRWPEAEVGLWYVFFMPQAIQRVQWGELRLGAHLRPALAITYQPPPLQGKRQPRAVSETVYIAFATVEDGNAILADLLVDLPVAALAPALLPLSPPR